MESTLYLLLGIMAYAASPALPVEEAGRPLPRLFSSSLDGRFAAIVRAKASPETLAAFGVDVRRRPDGTPRRIGGMWVVDGSLEALHAARAAGFDVQLARPFDAPPPTAVTGVEIEAEAIWASGPAPVGAFLGEGLAILDIDNGIDIYHPHFFRPDAGNYVWIDVDGNDRLDPGIDGIDLNDDGEIKPEERLVLIDAWSSRFNGLGNDLYRFQNEVFDPARDYVYLDSDGDGLRNFGKDAGFKQDDPGFGEPIFVADDVDRNGEIGPEERLLQLGSSRIAGVYDKGTWYERDRNLMAYDVDWESSAHGTSVGGILVGGQLPWQRDYHGIAPEADLWFATTQSDDADILEAMDHAIGEGVSVVLHEYAPWTGSALDGSSPIEVAVDALAEEGIVHVCPAGNLADAEKHTVATVTQGQLEVKFDVPANSPFEWDYQWVLLDLHAEAGTELLDACSVITPSLQRFDLAFTASTGSFGPDSWHWADRWRTDRDRPMHEISLWREDAKLEAGTWTLTCGHPDDGTPFHIYLNDYISGWDRGVTLHNEVRANTMGIPSTSDSCISVGAYAGRWGDKGELRTWSSRGPTVDGRRTIDITAPDDPDAPQPTVPELEGWFAPYNTFGGTSGAAPHVAALAALMQAAEPGWSPDRIRTALIEGAAYVDGVADDPNGWGAGKVRGYSALYGTDAQLRPDPVEISVDWVSYPSEEGCIVSARGVAAGEPDARFSFDINYDGVWDIDFGQAAVLGVLEGPTPLRVEAEAGGWPIGGTVVSVQPQDAPCEPAKRHCGCASTERGAPIAALLLLGVFGLRRRGR